MTKSIGIFGALLSTFAIAAGVAQAQEGGGPLVNQTVFGNASITELGSVTEVSGRGQKIIAAVAEFDQVLDAEAFDPTSLEVAGRNILSAHVTSGPALDAAPGDGRFVILMLDPEDEAATIFGPNTDIAAQTVLRQTGALPLANGGELAPPDTAVINTRVSNLVVDDFRQFRYTDPDTGLNLPYNLFIPKDYDPAAHYPLVLFMHDAGVTGSNPLRTLEQGLGAISFASAENQAKHPSFVLAPQYPVPLANDASQSSAYMGVTQRLIGALAQEYAIDTDRIYATGQSGGCMTSIAMNIAWPELFAATLCVAGQWDPDLVAPMAGARFWAIVSEDDAKAFPGMTAIVEMLAENGATVTRGRIDAKASAEDQAAAVAAIRADGPDSNIFFTTFTPGSVLPEGGADNPGAGHVNTWVYAYAIPALRDWLFEQSRQHP